MRLIKPILGSVVAAVAVTFICLFLPFVGLVVDEHPLMFFGAVLLLFVFINIWGRSGSRRDVSVVSDELQRKNECEEWWKKSSEATSCPSNHYDLRNIYRRLHMYDGSDD